ncbi:hypothetical protein PLICRDRAFT_41042 [Plicaturopsis crispa FD-325 SS-3]|nr:hypothetical protein PLICRDRAFT_41042 [Plicaturopsis crispa FD-325 SS-3]
MDGPSSRPSQPKHRQINPGPSILRASSSHSPNHSSRHPTHETSASIALPRTLGRPRTSLDDYYGPQATISDDRMELSLEGPAIAVKSTVGVGGGRNSVGTDKLPLASPPLMTTTRPATSSASLIHGKLVASGLAASQPQYIAHWGVSTRNERHTFERPSKHRGLPLRRPSRVQPDHSQDDFRDVVVTTWLAGKTYSPVLNPLHLPRLQALPELNPLLRSLHADGEVRIKWNMLYPSSYATCSPAMSDDEWSQHLHSPATFPRLRRLCIVSKSLPWIIHAHAEDGFVGVTCGDVIDEIHFYLSRFVIQEEVDELSPSHKAAFIAAYRANRSIKDEHGQPAASLNRNADAMRRLDWLARRVSFGGLDRDDDYLAARFAVAVPATFVLCSHEPDMDTPAQQTH